MNRKNLFPLLQSYLILVVALGVSFLFDISAINVLIAALILTSPVAGEVHGSWSIFDNSSPRMSSIEG